MREGVVWCVEGGSHTIITATSPSAGCRDPSALTIVASGTCSSSSSCRCLSVTSRWRGNVLACTTRPVLFIVATGVALAA